MTRLTYSKSENGTKVSKNFLTQSGMRVSVALNGNVFTIVNIEDGSVVTRGESNHPTYLKHLAKTALMQLVGDGQFSKEVRKRKANGVSYEEVTSA